MRFLQVINYNCKELVDQVPFFNEADESFVSSVLQKLDFEVFLAGEVIVKVCKKWFNAFDTLMLRSCNSMRYKRYLSVVVKHKSSCRFISNRYIFNCRKLNFLKNTR